MNDNTPRASIIIPTYNRPAQLRACLESVCRLDYPRDLLEVIVVDDGSRMPLEPHVAPLLGKVDGTLLCQSNGGPGVARNAGAARARGDVLAFTDDDCVVAPDWLRKLVSRLAGAAAPVIVGGRTENLLGSNPYSAASQAIMEFVYAYYNAEADDARFFASNNMAMPAEPFRKLGGFDCGWPLAASEDREFCDRWLYQGYRMIYVPEAVVYHSHFLSLGSFWRQHFNYGRGAFRFHDTRSRRRSVAFKPEVAFYMKMLNYPFVNAYGPNVLPRLLTWQIANTAGFVYEWLNSARRPSGRGLERTV